MMNFLVRLDIEAKKYLSRQLLSCSTLTPLNTLARKVHMTSFLPTISGSSEGISESRLTLDYIKDYTLYDVGKINIINPTNFESVYLFRIKSYFFTP